MKRIAFLWVAVATVARVGAFTAPHTGTLIKRPPQPTASPFGRVPATGMCANERTPVPRAALQATFVILKRSEES